MRLKQIALPSSAFNLQPIVRAVAERNYSPRHNQFSKKSLSPDSDSIDQSNLFFGKTHSFLELPAKNFPSVPSLDSDRSLSRHFRGSDIAWIVRL